MMTGNPIVRQLTHSPHGRIVLYRDSLDDAISMLRVREKPYRLMTEKKEFTKEIMLRAADEIYFVPEGTPLSTQLVKFQRNKKKVGLVVDEYGDIQGLVTVEDILEEIVGDFTTSMSPTLAEEVTPLNDGTVIIDGSANVRESTKRLTGTCRKMKRAPSTVSSSKRWKRSRSRAPACALSSTI